MKKLCCKRLAAFGCALLLFVSQISMAGAQQADTQQAAVSDNRGAQNYTVWSHPVYSYLYHRGDGGISRVEYIQSQNQIVVEDYTSQFQLTGSRTIPMELSLFGGFYAGESENYLIFGQPNPQESDNTEVIRVVQYSKDWKRLGQASLYGANTTIPFDAGSLRCDEYNGYLYIRTCHEMYAHNGVNHQANLTFSVRERDMKITDQYTDVSMLQFGYVSHSFNQFILVDAEGRLVAVDHGDAIPRGMVLSRYYYPAGQDLFIHSPSMNPRLITAFRQKTFPGPSGQNETGASIGGFAETSTSYLTAYCDNGTGSGYTNRSVYLTSIGKSDLPDDMIVNGQLIDEATLAQRVRTVQLPSDDASTPILVPTSLSGGWILWNGMENAYTPDDTLYYAPYTADGSVGAVKTAQAPLSDCQPIVLGDQIAWYVTDASAPTFYTLDDQGVQAHPIGSGETPDPDPDPEPEPDPDPDPTPVPGTTDLSDPRQASTLQAAIKQSANLQGRASGSGEVYAIDTDNVLWRWSQNDINTPPTKVLDQVRQVDARQVVVAVREDNTLWAWGRLGALGFMDQFDDQSDTPVKVMDDVQSAAASNFGLMALKTDGSLWFMGSASLGEDGLGTRGSGEIGLYHVMDNVAMVDSGASRYVALKTDGSVWVWGADGYTGADKYISFRGDGPQPLTKILDGMVQVGMESENGWAIDKNGALWSWGLAEDGAAGCGDRYDYYDPDGMCKAQTVPVKILERDVISARSGMAVLKDGSWYGWGYFYNSSVPVKQPGSKVIADTQGARIYADGSVWTEPWISGVANVQKIEKFFLPDQVPEDSGFLDVPEGIWYAFYVNRAAEAGLVQGMGERIYSPETALQLSQVVSLTARLHAETHGKTVPASALGQPWYQGAYQYCLEQGLFTSADVKPQVLELPATRYQMVDLLDRAVDDSYKTPINEIPDGFIPDVRESDPYGDVVYRWYRAGIAQGDNNRAFLGTSHITRAEMAVFLCRLMNLAPRAQL